MVWFYKQCYNKYIIRWNREVNNGYFNSNQSYVIHEKQFNTNYQNNCQKSYSILEKDGNLNNNYFCVMNHLYVNSNRQNDFKDKFLNRFKRLNTVTGYKALRF